MLPVPRPTAAATVASAVATAVAASIAAWLLVAVPASAAPPPEKSIRAVTSKGGIPSIRYEKYTLSNGLEVILAEDHRLPLVAFNVWYHVGARNERPGLTGFAHLFEHLMFAGSRHIARGTAVKLVVASGGTDTNGSTNFDRTNYHFTLPSSQLELGLWIKSDMMGYMIDEVDAVSLANQQDVVRNERRQRIENQPYGVVHEAVFHNLFPADHPYYALVMGSHADIQAATLSDVKAFSKTYYRPNNATLVLAGDFEKAKAKALIAKYFGTLRRGDPVPVVHVAQPKLTAERRQVVEDRVELPRVYMAWHTSAAFKPGDAELDVASLVLGSGNSSRLYKKLVYEKQIAQDVNASQQSLSLGSVFEIVATARPGHTAAELEQAINEEINGLASAPPSAEEVERARNTLETQIVRSVEKLFGVADMLNRYNQLAGDPGFMPKDIARYRAVTPQAVTAQVSAQLRPDTRVVVYGVPGKQVLAAEVPPSPAASRSSPADRETVNPDEVWREKRPTPGSARPLALPSPRSFTLPNGLTVVHVANPGVPMVSATLVARAGTSANPADRPGLASFTATMLQEGTKRRSALALADEVALMGAALDSGATRDDARVTVTSLKRNFAPTLDILADVVTNPMFADDEIERQKKGRLARLLQQHENAPATASVVAAAALFGIDHPLGPSALGTEDSIRAMSREELARFWRGHYRPEQTALVVAGDITFAELQRLAKEKLGGWRGEGEALSTRVPAPSPTDARLVLVDKPGAPQTALNVVGPGPIATDPVVPPLAVANAVLGGNFTSRINHTLREVKGYTYGIYSSFDPGREVGQFSVRGSVRSDVTGAALADLFKEIEGVRAEAVPRDELEDALNSQLLSLPGAFETNAAMATSFAAAWSKGQGLDYYARLPARLSKVDAAEALALTRKYVMPDSLIVVAVGDRAKITPQLEALGRKPIEVRDLDGRPIP